MKELSDRIRSLGTENAFVVLKEVNELKAQGKDIKNFCIGQPDFPTPKNICEAAKDAIDKGFHGYTPSPGIPELRKAAAKYFSDTRGIKVDPDWVVVGCGGKPFISHAIFCTTEYGKGHEVIFPNPGFPIYESMIRGNGAVPVPLYLRESKGFNFDIDDLRSRITDKTRLLILNSPQNPTGGVLSRAEMAEIAQICQKHDIWVYADEVYSQLIYDGVFESITAHPGMQDRTILVDCASKTYAMTGWRIGYMANRLLSAHISTLITNTDSCAPNPCQRAVAAGLEGPQVAVRHMVRTFQERREVIVAGLNRLPGLTCLQTGGAVHFRPNGPERCTAIGGRVLGGLRKILLHEAGVAVLADIHFGPRVPDEGQHIRFSYASSTEDIKDAIERIRKLMEAKSS